MRMDGGGLAAYLLTEATEDPYSTAALIVPPCTPISALETKNT